MQSETIERMGRIRSRGEAGKAALAELKAQLADNNDKYIKEQVQRVANSFNDVEDFLAILNDERMPPRTSSEESRVLDHAEFFLEKITLPQLKAVQDLIAKFGANIQSIG